MSEKKLMIPGPVAIPEEVRYAMAVPSMPHYGREWIRLFNETREMAKQLFGTQHDLLIVPGPGTMALEMGLASALEPGDAVAIPLNGFFAERLVTVVERNGLVPVTVDIPLGRPVLGEDLLSLLEAHPEVQAVALVHHETSTGVLNPVRELAEVARSRGALVVLDAVSSMGGVPLPVDAWGIDVCVTVANKVLETPPGVALMSVSPRVWEAVERRQALRGWYLDLKTWRWYEEHWGQWHPTPVTMPTSNIYTLHRSLEMLLAEGVERRYAAYRAAAQAVRRGLETLGFPMFVEEAYASPLATAFRPREDVRAAQLIQWLRDEADIMISGGIGELRGKIMRVGHMGLARKRDYVVAFLLAVEDYLRRQGVDVPHGASLVALNGVER